MKLPFYSQLLIATLLMFLAGMSFSCKSTSASTASSDSINIEEEELDLGFNSLLDMLRREPGLTINGNGPNATVTMRGFRTVEGTNEPLFTIDGAPLGFGYDAASSVDVTTVKSIKVLSPAQSGLYGSRGGNGVIQITTKE